MTDPSNPELTSRKYRCEKHGIGAFVMSIELLEEPVLTKIYCMRCFVEKLDMLDVLEMEAVE